MIPPASQAPATCTSVPITLLSPTPEAPATSVPITLLSPTPQAPVTSMSPASLQQEIIDLQRRVINLERSGAGSSSLSLLKSQEIRTLKFQEEVLKLERTKVRLQQESLEIQKKICNALVSRRDAELLLNSMCEP